MIGEQAVLDAVRKARRLGMLIVGDGIAYDADKAKLECIGEDPTVEDGEFRMRQQTIWVRDVADAAGAGMLQSLERKGCKVGMVDGLCPLGLARWSNAIWGNDGIWPDIEVEPDLAGKKPFDFGNLRATLTAILRERFSDIQHWADGDFYRVCFPEGHPAYTEVWDAMGSWCRETPEALASGLWLFPERHQASWFIEARPPTPDPPRIAATMRDRFRQWECDLVLIVSRGRRRRDIDIIRQWPGANVIAIAIADEGEVGRWDPWERRVFAIPGEDVAARETAWLDFLGRLERAARFIPDADRIYLYGPGTADEDDQV